MVMWVDLREASPFDVRQMWEWLRGRPAAVPELLEWNRSASSLGHVHVSESMSSVQSDD
jgi:hypothetical protein